MAKEVKYFKQVRIIEEPFYPKSYEKITKRWLRKRYGKNHADLIWERLLAKYHEFLDGSPDYGGRKNGHSMSIYGAMLVFAMIAVLPDQPSFDELQEFTQNLFMDPFKKLGKLVDLNRSRDLLLMDRVFRHAARRDSKDLREWPKGFHNVYDGYDRTKHTTSYHFTHCPVAEFAKENDMLRYLPLMCNCDFYGIEQIHGQLIREGTCGISDRCDYLVVGDDNPIATEYETIKDENGLLVSRKRQTTRS